MKRLLQINITANWGSHGKIAEDIGKCVIAHGWESYIAYGRWANPSESHLIRIGSLWDERIHAVQSRLLDNHGLASRKATRKLIDAIKNISPDVIHLHNIHGYYLNYPLLFDFLAQYGKPVVWTLHDCWPFTGHCSHFEFDGCFKWQDECFNCQYKMVYPTSILLEQSNRNFLLKKECFTSLKDITLVPVSEWLAGYVKESFLGKQRIKVIHNGVDINTFKPIQVVKDNDVVELLGVASNWRMRKGLPDFIQLRGILPTNYHITLIGLSKKEIAVLPSGINGIERTNSVEELVDYYNKADIFVNPTYEDNFPTVNIEALSCGTPVLTYRTGGSPEAVTSYTGWVVEQGDVQGMASVVWDFASMSEVEKKLQRKVCRERAEKEFNKDIKNRGYLELYEQLLEKEC